MPARSLFNEFTEVDALVWSPEIGIGWYPVIDQPYNQDYWEKYVAYDKSDMGRALTDARIQWVTRFYNGSGCDIGIGAGLFCREIGWKGFDVNEIAIDWLIANSRFGNPYQEKFGALSFWDSLEHIANPSIVLSHIKEWAFVSIPIFNDLNHLLSSKHFRKDEHFWYFTNDGFLMFMDHFGFDFVASSNIEEQLGREDITTYAFRRKYARAKY